MLIYLLYTHAARSCKSNNCYSANKARQRNRCKISNISFESFVIKSTFLLLYLRVDFLNFLNRYSQIWTHKRTKQERINMKFYRKKKPPKGSNIKSSVALKWCNYFPKLCKWEISFSHQISMHYISYYSWNYYISKLLQMVCYLDFNWERRKKES